MLLSRYLTYLGRYVPTLNNRAQQLLHLTVIMGGMQTIDLFKTLSIMSIG